MAGMPEASKRAKIWSWAFFDFAASAFATLIITFIFPRMFTQNYAASEVEGSRMWGNAVATAAVLIALLSPPLGAVADAYGWKKRMMALFIVICSMSAVALYFPVPGQVYWALGIFIVGNVSLELSVVFNNGFLPELAGPREQGKLSGRAWALGYVGGLLCLIVALVGFVQTDDPWFGLSKENLQHVRATNILVGIWVFVFCLPMLFILKEPRAKRSAEGVITVARRSFYRLGQTFSHIRQYQNAFWLLIARMFYNDGLTTVFTFGAVYASGTFGFSFSQVIVFGIALNVCAGLGAFGFSFIEDHIGSRNTIVISIIGLVSASGTALFIESQTAFWVCAIVLGTFIGPNQSASRALLSRLAPREKVNEFFGFFAFSGKATAFVGPFLCGQLTGIFDSQRVGMSVIPVLILAGGLILVAKVKGDD